MNPLETMCHKNLRVIYRILGVGALTIMVGLIGLEVAQRSKRCRRWKKADIALDDALNDSMDCSDAVAKY